MSSLQQQLLKAGWCYESSSPMYSEKKSEIYKDWEIITYPELALHYLPTGEHFIGSNNPSRRLRRSQAPVRAIKALIDSAD